MIDLVQLREKPAVIGALIRKKEPSFPVDRLLILDEQVRLLKTEIDALRHTKNELANQGKQGPSQELKERSRATALTLKEKETHFELINHEFQELYLRVPNLPMGDVPPGGKESNKPVKIFGAQPVFDFEPKNHVELNKNLGWFDFEAAARMSGTNFVIYKADGARLCYALTMFMLKNNVYHGFEPVVPPYLVTAKSLECAGNFPKFKDQVYAVEADNLFLIPTSEVSLTNIYRDHIFTPSDLPIRMTAATSCFRREAGTYGSTERGLIRVHQFEKVELYSISNPLKSNDELDQMIACAELILQKLGLHYRISLLAAQDMSFQAAKTYDIEVWMPGQKAYSEVSSCSNCGDFQARRSAIRFKETSAGKPQLVHTLNASSLALPRLIVAIMETYQQEDGTVVIPEILRAEGMW